MEQPGQPFVYDNLTSRVASTTAEALADGFEPVPFVWDRRIPCGKVTVFAGAGGGGKSSLLVGLAIARAIGKGLFRIPTMEGSTLFISGEDTPTDYWRRITAWTGQARGVDLGAIARNVKVLDFVGEDYRLVVAKGGDYFIREARVNGIVVAARSMIPRPSMIVVETASRFGAGDETNGSAAALVNACESIARQTGAAVVLVAHVGKSHSREQTIDAYAARGGSALADNARAVLVLSEMPKDPGRQKEILGRKLRDGERILVLAAPKENFAPGSAPILLQRFPTPQGLVLREYVDLQAASAEDDARVPDAETVEAAALSAEARRAAWGNKLREVVALLAARGVTVGTKALKGAEYATLLSPIPARAISDAIVNAIEDGYLVAEAKPEGRGHRILRANYAPVRG